MQEPITSDPSDRPTAVVADDEEDIRELIAEMLTESGFSVETARNGREAMARIRKGHVSLLIVDLIMPEQEGIETIQQLRRERPDLPVIAISGGGHPSSLNAARLLGARQTLRKPFTYQDLRRTVHWAIAGHGEQ